MRRLYAVKRLADVEVRPDKSHQHELNAGLLRRALRITATRVTGPIEFLFYKRDGDAPFVGRCDYTLYDAREGTPDRTEFRLYCTSALIESHAQTGDLLVVTRLQQSKELQAFVVRQGTRRERDLVAALELDDAKALSKFLAVEVPAPIARGTANSLVAVSPPSASVVDHPLVARSAREGKVPPPRDLAAAANEVVAHISDPDEFIDQVLTVETDLFYAAETAVHTPRLHKMIAAGSTHLDEVLGFAMSIHQSRRSRRGASLQLHFGALLTREGIHHTPQCRTEGGETPDFIIPGYDAYHNARFPEGLLRMVACKSTVRERWGQILKEAKRIPEKYLLTLDEQLTDDTIRKMSAVRLRLFLPKVTISGAYAGSPERTRLAPIGDLIRELRAVTQ